MLELRQVSPSGSIRVNFHLSGLQDSILKREMCRREKIRFPGLPLLGLDPEVGQRHDFVIDLHILGRGAGAAAVQEA